MIDNEKKHVDKQPLILTISTIVALGVMAFASVEYVLEDVRSVLFLPIPLALGYVMARSVFGRCKSAANIVGAIGLGLGLFLLFALVVSLGEVIVDGDYTIASLIGFTLSMLLPCAILIFFGILSIRWGRRLQYDRPLVPTNPVLGKLLITMMICLCVIGFLYTAYLGFTDVDYAEHVDSVSWLPAEASDICYYKSYSFTAYEFDISEQGFLDWAKAGWSGWDVQPITSPRSIYRYGVITDQSPPPEFDYSDDEPTGEEFDKWARAHQAWENNRGIQIRQGYYYGEEIGNGGGGVYVGYDSETGRAYYHSTPR